MELIYNDDPDRLLDYIYADLRSHSDPALFEQHHPYFDPSIFSFGQWVPGEGWRSRKPNSKVNIAWTQEIPTPEFFKEAEGMFKIVGALPINSELPDDCCFFPWHMTEVARNNPNIIPDFTAPRKYFADGLFGINKDHRADLFTRIKEAGLIDSMLISLLPSHRFALSSSSNISYRTPALMDYEHVILRQTFNRSETWDSMQHVDLLVYDPIIDKAARHTIPASQFLPRKIYEHSWVSVVAETVSDREWFFPTEKTAKAIAGSRIFLVSGSRDFIRMLQSIGFKTFGNIIDESYIELFDFKNRNQKLVNELACLSESNMTDIYAQVIDILHFNRKLLFGRWLTKPVKEFLLKVKTLS